MLDPEYLERAGDLVGAVYTEIEAEMVDVLVQAMLEGDLTHWKTQAALQILPQRRAAQLVRILEEHQGDIDRAVEREVREALQRSDLYDLAMIKRALGIEYPGIPTMQVMYAVKTVGEMLARDNVDLMGGAREAFFEGSAWAVTQTEAGIMSPEQAVQEATRRLAREGIEMVQYRDPTTGNKTVRNRVDVAVRRHVRSQLSQACADRTMQVCEDVGCQLVEVSSHYGARPSHQDWEGRVYAIDGPATIDGVTYEDFGEATGYYGTGDHGALGDRLQGVNCRHHFGPWFPGMPRAFEPNPQHPSGKSNEEIYELTQKQRRLERQIRADKRELAAAKRVYEHDSSLKNQTDANRIREQLAKHQQALHDLCEENSDVLKRQSNREWAGDMPRTRLPKPSGRALDDFLRTDAAQESLKSRGITTKAAEDTMRANLEAMGMTAADFKMLTASAQDGMLRSGRFHYAARTASTANNRLSPQKQAKHIEGTKEHADYRARRVSENKSYQSDLRITQGEVRELIKTHAGKGMTDYTEADEWIKQETCEADRIVGVYYDMGNTPHETRWFKIMYAKRNTHIVPVKEPRNGNRERR